MTTSPDWLRNGALFVAVLSTAVNLVPALSHLFVLGNKLGLGREDYFVVQGIYAGWNRFAFVLLVQFISLIAVACLFRYEAKVLWPAIVALLCLIVAQVVFWIWTYPATVATENWTQAPENWQALRNQWEYSHAAAAIFQFLAMALITLATLRR